jgi:hypothetical protein
MKKLFFSLSAAALLAVGCAENVVVDKNPIADPNAIGFELGTGKMLSRATDNTLSTLQTDPAGFGVYAFSGVAESQTNPLITYIDNKAYVYTDGEWNWSGADAPWQYWPEVGKYPISFFAYYPKASVTTLLSLDVNSATYEIADAVGSQVDYLAANHVNVTAQPADSKVKLDFQHITTKINFKVTTGAGIQAHVQSIKVKNVANERSFHFGFLRWEEEETWEPTYASAYSYMATPAPNVFQTFAASTTAAPVTAANGSMMLMPQVLTDVAWPITEDNNAPEEGESYLEIVYRVNESDLEGDYLGFMDASNHPNFDAVRDEALNGKPLYVKVGYPLGTEWYQGKAYTYVFVLGDAKSSAGNYVSKYYIDENGNETDLELIGGSDVPDPVYPDNNDKIGFNVDVADWDEVSAITI